MMKMTMTTNNYEYHIANLNDLKEVMEVIEDGRKLLKEEGNGQWQDGYPNTDDLRNDILNQQLYCVTLKGLIIGVMAITGREDAYHYLYEGEWLTNLDYLVMHRIAVRESNRESGVGTLLFQIFEEVAQKNNIHSLRIDTHQNNDIMVHLLKKCGFTYCGKVILPPHKDRIVFEKVI